MRTEPSGSVPQNGLAQPTLVEVISELVAAGYDHDAFVREEDGSVCCSGCRSCQPPDQLQLDGIRRLEGTSDPADMAAVLAVRCPTCGVKATAVVRYGPEANAGEAILLRTMDDVRPSGLDVAERSAENTHADVATESPASPPAGAPMAEAVEPALQAAGGRWLDAVHGLEQAEALDAARPTLERLVASIPGPMRRVLRGDWLGHPVHPALTDLPIGFWTSSFVLDLVPTKGAARVSTAFVGLGIASVVPTAAAGLVDWAELSPEKQRVAAVHIAANSAATIAYTASFVARLRGRRLKGVALGMAGAALATAGGMLGGHLAFGSSED